MATVTIRGLADELGVSIDTVRYYERRGLLPEPERTASGYRTYGDDDRWRLAFILRAKALGFTLREIRDLLGRDSASVRTAVAAKLADVERQRRELDTVAASLAKLVHICDAGDEVLCGSLGTTCGP